MTPDFRDLFRALSDAGARFLVVGAYAVSFHSEPRATGDLDIWIDPLEATYTDLVDLELLQRHRDS